MSEIGPGLGDNTTTPGHQREIADNLSVGTLSVSSSLGSSAWRDAATTPQGAQHSVNAILLTSSVDAAHNRLDEYWTIRLLFLWYSGQLLAKSTLAFLRGEYFVSGDGHGDTGTIDGDLACHSLYHTWCGATLQVSWSIMVCLVLCFRKREAQDDQVRVVLRYILSMHRFLEVIWFTWGNLAFFNQWKACREENVVVFRFTLAVLILLYIRMLIIMSKTILIILLFPLAYFFAPFLLERLAPMVRQPSSQTNDQQRHPRSNLNVNGLGATKEEIKAIKSIAYSPDLVLRDGSPQCSVCLIDYTAGMKLKILDCRHHFCQRCIDHWLIVNKTCPMCRTTACASSVCHPTEAQGANSQDGAAPPGAGSNHMLSQETPVSNALQPSPQRQSLPPPAPSLPPAQPSSSVLPVPDDSEEGASKDGTAEEARDIGRHTAADSESVEIALENSDGVFRSATSNSSGVVPLSMAERS